MHHRLEQIESTLRRAISVVLQRGLSDPRIRGLVSVTKLDVSPDVQNATVYVSVLPEEFSKRTIAGLRHAARRIHALVSKQTALRTVPHLHFKLDEGLKKQAQVYAAIEEGMAQTRKNDPSATDETAPPAQENQE